VENLQIRLPEDDVAEIDEIARRFRSSRSDAARMALDEGLRSLRMDHALDAYAKGDFTLARAAEYAGVSLQRLAMRARERGIAYFRQPEVEAQRDAAAAADLLPTKRSKGKAR
jgi:predicted HTH domain antitoxin